MAASVIQPSLNAGELAPQMDGRVDLAKYRSGLAVCRNAFVDYRGGVSSRSGTLFCGPCGTQHSLLPPRLIPFQFNVQQTYALELGDQYMQIITQGGYVLENSFAITAGTVASPMALTIPGHNFAPGNYVVLGAVVGLARPNGISGINGRTLVVSTVVGNVVTFYDILAGSGSPLSSATWTAYTSGGTAARVYRVTTPWAIADLYQLNYAQSVDVLTVVHEDYPIYEIRRLGATNWTIAPLSIGATVSAPSSTLVTPTNGTGAGTIYNYGYTVTATDPDTGQESVVAPATTCQNFALNPAAGCFNYITWTPVTLASGAAPVYNIYATLPTPETLVPPFFWGLMGRAFGTSFTDNNYTSDESVVPPTNQNPFANGPLVGAFIRQAGFGYIAPKVTITDTVGSGGSILATANSAGAVTALTVAQAGINYVAPTLAITDGIATLGGGLAMSFSGALTAAAGGGFNPSTGSITTVTPGTGYHVPYWTLTPVVPGPGTWNPLDATANVTLSGGNLIAADATNATFGEGVRGTTYNNVGKYYFEVTLGTAFGASVAGCGLGLATAAAIIAGNAAAGTNFLIGYTSASSTKIIPATDGVMAFNGVSTNTTQVVVNNGSPFGTIFARQLASTDVIGIAVDMTAKLIWFKNLTTGSGWNFTLAGNPAAGTGGVSFAGLSSNNLFPVIAVGFGAVGTIGTYNGGQNTFTGTAPSGFQSGWGTQTYTGATGVPGFGYYTVVNGVPTSIVTLQPAWVPATTGFNFVLTVSDTLPGQVIGASQALATPILQTENNPAVVALFDQRRVFAASISNPDTFWMSKPGAYSNFDTSFPEQPNDSIDDTIVGQEVNAITSLTPMSSGLIALTSNGAYQLSGGQPGAALTPASIAAQAQAFSGASSLAPLRINYDLVYETARGSAVRDLSYNFYVNVYTGNDISALSSHLFFGNSLAQWGWSEEPFKLVWAVRNDGVLLSCTFMKEQEVYGWTRHDTAGLFKSVCVLAEGDTDAAYFIVSRYVAGQFVYYTERMQARYFGANSGRNIPSDPEKAWSVDAGVEYAFSYPAANILSGSPGAPQQIYSLEVIAGGSGYPNTPFAEIIDPTGTGAQIALVSTGGVITGGTVVLPGTGYTNPVVKIQGGTDAVIGLRVVDLWTFTVDSGVFGGGNVGSVLRVNGGRGVVLTIPSSTQIMCDMQIEPGGLLANIPASIMAPVLQGAWSLTAPVSVVGGLDHLTGTYAAVVADGGCLNPQLIVDGCLTLPQPASQILAGAPFTVQLQTLRLDVGEPTIQGRRKNIPAVTLRAVDTRGLSIGSTFDTLVDMKEREYEAYGNPTAFQTGGGQEDPPFLNGPVSPRPYAYADRRTILDARYNVDGQFCVQQNYPMPMTLLADIVEVEVGDTQQ